MTYKVGQIAYVENERAGYKKWHLCVCPDEDMFLCIDSHRYEGDFEITNQELPGSGLRFHRNFISCSTPVYMNTEYLEGNGARRRGSILKSAAQRLLEHVSNSKTFTPPEREKIMGCLEGILSK